MKFFSSELEKIKPLQMKNTSLIINVILGIAVAILYFLHFSGGSASPETSEVEVVADSSAVEPEVEPISNGVIAYVDMDSLQDQYGLFEELSKKLTDKEKYYKNTLEKKQREFEAKYIEAEKKAKDLSQFQQEMLFKELQEDDRKLRELQERYMDELTEAQYELTKQLKDAIQGYVKKYNAENQFQMIIATSSTRNMVLDFNNEIDITNVLVKGLNEEYEAKNAEAAEAKEE